MRRNIEKLFVIVLVCFLTNVKRSESFGTFGLDVHHRYSDIMKDFLGHDGLPEKGTVDYFTTMAHHDHLVKARRLAGGSDGSNPTSTSSILTFDAGNDTYRVRSLGSLHYSYVTVGTPPVDYLVALDTGSDLFWLPCDCTNCMRSFNTTTGKPLKLEIYSPSTSSTSSSVPCNSTMCGSTRGCLTRQNTCSYEETYRKFATSSSTGILVNDVLRMGTDEIPTKPVNVPITLGPSYNVTVTQIGVGRNVTDITFTTLFESGMAYTYLTEPAYSIIAEGFNSRVDEPRYIPPTPLLFDYCYNLSATQETYSTPFLNLTMAGGNKFHVSAKTTVYLEAGGQYIYCLTLVKSTDISIIGQNFMTGHRMVFDRDDMVLGWEKSDCYDSILSTNTSNKGNSPNAPPPPSIPETTPGNRNRFPFSPSPRTPPSPTPLSRSPATGNAAKLSSMLTNIIWMIMISISVYHFIVPYL